MAKDTFINRVKNYVFPTPDNGRGSLPRKTGGAADRNLRNYITPVQLQRLRHDVQMWRDAIKEAENAWYPHRVKMQRMFIDTILSGHTLACVKRRKQLTLLREWSIVDSEGEPLEDITKTLKKQWFASFIEYALEARFFGYSLIALNDLEDDQFKGLQIVRRFNVSPDRLNVPSIVYQVTGANFMEPPYADWHVWIPTASDVGVSEVGYGLLYNVAVYEIIARNVLGFNADAAELFGMPVRVGTTSKTEESERGDFEAALANMGSAGYILKDALDEVELMESSTSGQGYKIFESLEKRCEQKVSKIILGHADAIDSTPGKLGSANDEESPVQKALRDTQAEDGTFLENVVNGILMPKLIAHGFNIPQGAKFAFDNNAEKEKKRVAEDKNNKATADIAYTMKQAGLAMSPEYFEERTGIATDLAQVDEIGRVSLPEKVKNRLREFYSQGE